MRQLRYLGIYNVSSKQYGTEHATPDVKYTLYTLYYNNKWQQLKSLFLHYMMNARCNHRWNCCRDDCGNRFIVTTIATTVVMYWAHGTDVVKAIATTGCMVWIHDATVAETGCGDQLQQWLHSVFTTLTFLSLFKRWSRPQRLYCGYDAGSQSIVISNCCVFYVKRHLQQWLHSVFTTLTFLSLFNKWSRPPIHYYGGRSGTQCVCVLYLRTELFYCYVQTSVPSSSTGTVLSGFLGGIGGLIAGLGLPPAVCGCAGGLLGSAWWGAVVPGGLLGTASELSVDLSYKAITALHSVAIQNKLNEQGNWTGATFLGRQLNYKLLFTAKECFTLLATVGTKSSSYNQQW